ncbi:MAG: hypothetical protein D6705_18965 [Deltaproteobacteria bacterium]|nr:MAG: hypothetical protein D6705_18965 [Deltaproteobacteria bacterium]
MTRKASTIPPPVVVPVVASVVVPLPSVVVEVLASVVAAVVPLVVDVLPVEPLVDASVVLPPVVESVPPPDVPSSSPLQAQRHSARVAERAKGVEDRIMATSVPRERVDGKGVRGRKRRFGPTFP